MVYLLTFKFAVTSAPLASATLEPILYQTGKPGLNNYMINLQKNSSHRYPRDVKWVADGLTAIRSVPPRDTYSE